MTTRPDPAPTSTSALAGFLAVLVVAIILIAIAHPNPALVTAVVDILVAYLTWQAAVEGRSSRGGDGPAVA
jgi:hypothetical protein